MNLADTLAAVRAAGFTLAADASGPTLRGTGPAVPQDLVATLRAHRSVLELLVARPGIEALPAAVRHITRPADLVPAAQAIAAAPRVGFDLETTGLDARRDRPRLAQVAVPGGAVYVFDYALLGTLGPVGEVLAERELVGHHLQFDLQFAAHRLGFVPRAVWCTLTASRLLDGGEHAHVKEFHTLRSVAARWLGLDLPKDEQTSDWSGALAPRQIAYAARDAAVVLVLRDALTGALAAQGLADVVALENALLPVLVDMWDAGVGFAPEAWEALRAQRARVAHDLEARLREALRVGLACDLEDVNPNSQRQVLAALTRRGLPARGTSKEDLAAHAADPVVADLLQYRSLMSFLRGPAKTFPEAAALYTDGRIRARFDPLAAPTGRFGCSRPNLQGLEKTRKVAAEADAPEARACVVPHAGNAFVVADYAAIELRVLAQITGDARLRGIFAAGGDPHRAMAALVAGKAEAEVTKLERNRAKAVNFGFPFGMGETRFIEYAQALYGVTFTGQEAKAFKAAWARMYPGVVAWQKRIGRASPPMVNSRSGRQRRFASRHEGYCERLNMPVQGTAADGIKNAMVLLHARLPAYGARIVLCVHDELVVECPRAHALAVKGVVERTMVEGMARYVPDVPIVVEADIRTTWSAQSVIAEGAP